MKKKRIKILTSFDDGDQLDMTLAEMLIKYKIPSVFYVPIKTRDLMDNQIRKLAGVSDCEMCKKTRELFDIGAHTMTHPEDMKTLSSEELRYEINGSKEALELLIGKPVTRFCYPSGRYNDQVKEAVKNAGFKEARTTMVMSTEFPKDPFATYTTAHVYPDRKEYKGETWKYIAESKLEDVLENGGRFELWGHSWEIEKFNMWEFLDDFLWYMNEKMLEIDYPRRIDIPYYEID